MATKIQTYAQLAEDTAKGLTRSLEDWTGFLNTVGRLYKYPYHEQLMIYAQRPDARACAEYDLWNNTMNRYVRRGSKGIALLDTTADIPRLRYVFDVSDTGSRENSRYPYLWDMKEDYKEPILEMLKGKYGSEDNNLFDAFYKIARNMSREYYNNHKRDMGYLIEDSFLEEYDEENLQKTFEDAATVSTAYTLMKRCGFDTDGYFEHEDFLPIFNFNTADAIALLGTAISEQSEEIFREIAITIIKTERERSEEYERSNLHKEWGIPDTRHRIGRTDDKQRPDSTGQIRQNEETISSGTQESTIQLSTPSGETVPTPVGDRQDGKQTDGTNHDRLTEGTDPAGQDDTADGMGGLHEQSESTSRGNYTEGTNLQLSLFPSEVEQIQRIARKERINKPFTYSAFSMPQNQIDSILRTGNNKDDGLLRIISFYQKNKSLEEKADFLQKEYQGGKGLYIENQTVSL